MKKGEFGLSTKQRQALAHILSGKTQRETAEVLGVHENTLTDWTRLPAFQAELRAGQRRIMAEVVNRLSVGGSSATAYLVKVLTDRDEVTTNRLRAADRLLSHYMTAYATAVTSADLADLQRRIEELESER